MLNQVKRPTESHWSGADARNFSNCASSPSSGTRSSIASIRAAFDKNEGPPYEINPLKFARNSWKYCAVSDSGTF